MKSPPSPISQTKDTIRVILIGAGNGGKSLLEIFSDDPMIAVVGVADKNEQASGFRYAQELKLPVTTNYQKLLATTPVDIIINVTGDPEISRELYALKPERTELIGGTTARLICELIWTKKQSQALEEKYQLALRELEAYAETEFIIGNSPQMKEVSRLITQVAPTPTTVLISGESGTGKELVARAIHRHSLRSSRVLVTLNCTALPPTLLESELFGYKRGAFTGAFKDQIGLFEKADGGTMFLDEIGDMSLEVQAKLLRTLQTGEIRAVGDVKSKVVSVRIIAATNRDLKKAIEEGRFREDLYYRINTFTIMLPPLRERKADIPLLAEYFLLRARAKVNKRVEVFSPKALDLLRQYDWPGNLRELENIIERAVVLTNSTMVEAEHLPIHVQEKNPSLICEGGFMEAKAAAIDRYEKEVLLTFLTQAQGNVSVAAKMAKLPRRTFHRLLSKHQVIAARFKGKKSK